MRPHRYLIPAAAFLAILPILVKGPTCGHDFDFHLLSWLEAATQYTHGQYPHWAYTPAFNAGEPRFLFYPPISWTLGALLTLLVPIQYAATAFTFLALTLSGFTAHRLAQATTRGPSTPTLCAILYLLNPYMLFTAYERSAYGELLAAAFLPLLFQAALLTHTNPRRQTLAIALPLALIWLTNAPAAVMATYALALLTLLRLAIPAETRGFSPTTSLAPTRGASAPAPPTRRHLALTTLAGTLLGLTLPAFYLLPAAWQRRNVQIAMANVEGMRPQDHFLFHTMPGLSSDVFFHNAVVHTASLVALLLVIPALLLLLRLWINKDLHTTLPLAALTVLLAFLLTPASLPLWNHTPELAFLQFPWRLSALLAVIFITLLAKALPKTSPFLLLLCPLLILPAWHFFHQPCDATDAPIARAALFHSPFGTEATDEYTPLHADPDADALPASIPPTWFVCLEADPHPDPNFSPSYKPLPGGIPDRLFLDLPCHALVTLNRRLYPNWAITLNNRPIQPATPLRDDGLITLDLPQGRDFLHLTFRRTTDQTLGILLSALAAAIALFLVKPPGLRKTT